MLWRDMRGRTKEIHKELQDLDSLCSPHLEERWIGGNIDLDLLSLFPQKYARIMGGMEEEGQAIQSQQWRREAQNCVQPKEEERGIYTPPPKMTVRGGIFGLKGTDNLGAGLSGQNPMNIPPPSLGANHLVSQRIWGRGWIIRVK
jgi:hypothetical protein